uniref:Uncharacterized protein n=1 Tax=Panagrolaimus superbus TaxID=310955 RepID=A0A914ZA76_9BILA
MGDQDAASFTPPLRNPSPSTIRSNNSSYQPKSSKRSSTDDIDGPITSGPAKMAKDTAKLVLLDNSKSMKKVAEAFTSNAAKRAKVLETISSTREEKHELEKKREEERHRAEIEKFQQQQRHADEKHKLEMERAKIQMEKEQIEIQKLKLELEQMKRQQQ